MISWRDSPSVMVYTGLVWYEAHESMVNAITREKMLKKWNRAWKIRLIEKDNPTWMDLYEETW